MKTLLVLAALLVGASAQARPNTQDLTAAQAKALVAQNGAIVLSTSSFGYDRFVANGSYCAVGEKAVAAYVPTLDAEAAFIGYTCVAYSKGDSVGSKTYSRNLITCKEGKTQWFTEEGNNGNDHLQNVLRVCNGGKWKRVYGADPVPPKKILCKEGSYRSERIDIAGSDHQKQVTVVCRAGKWYQVN